MGDILLSVREARRVHVMQQLVVGKVTAAEAAVTLSLSRRQVLRVKRVFAEAGPSALAHRNRGRSPAHCVGTDTRARVVELSGCDYKDATYAHLAQLLRERHDINLSAKTVGRILKQAGVAHKHSHRGPRRFRTRERMSQEGMLILMDASPHDWLEGRGPRLCLHGAIDDASSKAVGLHFGLQETTDGYMHVLLQVFANASYGIPARIYTDRHTIFTSPKKLCLAQELAGEQVALTSFGAALADLDVQHIKARSPQAKGRIERLWGTLQERLVVEMRTASISTLDEANTFLSTYINRHNSQFAIEALNSETAWRPAPEKAVLANTVAVREIRTASNASTFYYAGKKWQLLGPDLRIIALAPKAKVDVRIRLDNSMKAIYKNKTWNMAPCSS